MKQIQFIFFLSTLFLISCQNNAKQTDNSKKFPIVLDTVGIGEFLNSRGEEDPSLLAVANYKVYFIGKIKDSVYLSKSFNFYPPMPLPPGLKLTNKINTSEPENPFKKYYIEQGKRDKYPDRLEDKIDIQFDTAVKISSLFPVMVTNRETDTIFIGYGTHVPLIMEAMDSLGNWQPIQERFRYRYGCGTDLGAIILPPNESILTLVPTFKGNYKKKLRLTLGENHSKPFIGFIDYRL
jgi:hypothetical protein